MGYGRLVPLMSSRRDLSKQAKGCQLYIPSLADEVTKGVFFWCYGLFFRKNGVDRSPYRFNAGPPRTRTFHISLFGHARDSSLRGSWTKCPFEDG